MPCSFAIMNQIPKGVANGSGYLFNGKDTGTHNAVSLSQQSHQIGAALGSARGRFCDTQGRPSPTP